MKYSKLLLILFTGLVLSLGASEAKKAIEKRIAPVGSVCVQGEDCGRHQQLLLLLLPEEETEKKSIQAPVLLVTT